MKVSVIIPMYNVEKFIERCILSVLNQTWKDIEVVVVNDCSPDTSLSIVKNIAKTHPRGNSIKIIDHPVNKGIAGTRNTGINNATGDFLYFLDSDDYISLDCFELLVNAAKKYNVDLVVADFEVTGDIRDISGLKIRDKYLKNNNEILKSYLNFDIYIMIWNKLIRRTFFDANPVLFNENILHEDDLWSFEMALNLNSLYVISNKTYFYFINGESFSAAKNNRRNVDHRSRIIDIMYTLISESPKLSSNRLVYLIFENTKAKYYDRILYTVKDDNEYCKNAYLKFRNDSYISFGDAIKRFKLPLFFYFLNFHYILPPMVGYTYYKNLIALLYKWLLVKLRLKRILQIK